MSAENEMELRRKPLGGKSYGHIAHLPGSRMGPGDHRCHEGQKRIATEKARDKYDHIVCLEKLDGSNVGIACLDGRLFPLIRAGYLATSSRYEQHWRFAEWVFSHQNRFLDLLSDGERLCGEWLMQAHGTRYTLTHEPFVAFDLMRGNIRLPFAEMAERLEPADVIMPRVLHQGTPFSIDAALRAITVSGHGALDPVEGAVWRVERYEMINARHGGARAWKVDFLVKYVRPEKQDGSYLPERTGQQPVWNWHPDDKGHARALP